MPSVEVHLENGINYKSDGKFDEAIAEFNAAIEVDPFCDEAFHQVGLVYYFLGEFEENVNFLEKAVNLNPFNLKARVDLALSYMSVFCDYDKAREQLEEVIKMDPDNEEAKRHIQFC